MMHCDEATRLVSEAQDRPLDRGERVALRVHMTICSACRQYQRQLDQLRRWSQQFASRNTDTERNDDSSL